MKNHIILATILSFSMAILAGCATPTYKVGNQTYNNRDEAWAASKRQNTEAESAISTGIKPLVDRKVLIVFPTAGAFLRTFEAIDEKSGTQYASPGSPARVAYEFYAEERVVNMKSVVASLNKAKIYREVDFMEVDTTTPNVQASQTQDVISYHWGVEGGGVSVLYFSNVKTGKQVIAVDFGKTTLAERRRSLIDDMKAKALQQ